MNVDIWQRWTVGMVTTSGVVAQMLTSDMGQKRRFKSLPATSGLPPSTVIIRPGAVGPVGARRGVRENCKGNLAKRQSTFPASQTRTDNNPTGKSTKTCPAPLAKIFRLTYWANHLYKFTPSHPDEGRIARRHERAVGCDGRDSVGRARDCRAGLPVSDRPARGRTMLLTVFDETGRTARGPARPLA
jgi:hypothetical protein